VPQPSIIGHTACSLVGLPAAREAHGFLISQDDDGRRPRVEFLQTVREHFDLRDPVDALLREYRVMTLDGFPPIDAQIHEKLQALRETGWSIAVVTNGEDGVQQATIDQIGLSHLIDACVVSGAVGIRKPDARIFEIARDRCGKPRGIAWMVGGGEADVIGAARAGIRSVWLARGRQWTRRDVVPEAITESLLAALQLVSDARQDEA
jgi:FMN phosphatase YigB (HAD superfamily)